MKRKKKHQRLIDDYDTQKQKHLERLAKKMLDQDEKMNKLKNKNIKGDFLDQF